MGRVWSETREVSGLSQQHTTEFSYDYSGKLERVTYPDGNYRVDYAYHPGSGLLYSVTGSDSEEFAQCTSYTPTGRVGNIAHGNGTATSYTHDPCSHRLLSVWTIDSADHDIQKKEYTFSPAGDIQAIADSVNSATFNYTYDNLHRLRTENSGGAYPSETLLYDAIGNITSKSVGSSTYVYAYDQTKKHAVNTITYNGTPYQYAYDESGNLLEGPDFSEAEQVASREITNYANDMPSVVRHTKAGNTVTTLFDYDGLGKRIKKTVWGEGETYYLGDYYERENGTPVMYVYAGDLRVAKVAGSSVYYYHKDRLQSSSVLTGANGLSAESTQYMPFGHTRTPPGSSISNYKFTDQERDPETGLYNYDARHYDPVIGRFISADTLIQDSYDPQALNRYAYARNNPLKYVDPDGNIFWVPAIIGVAIGIGYDWIRSPAVANNPMSVGEPLADSPSILENISNYVTGVGLGVAAAGGVGALIREAGKEVLSEATGGISDLKDIGKGLKSAFRASKEAIQLSKARFGHTFTTHGQDATEFLINRAKGSGQPQGQFLDNQAAARFIQENLDKTKKGAVSIPVPKDFPARIINPDGTFTTPSSIRLVPGGKGVKSAYPEP
jgi:RHS repeat-associated protein